MCLRRSLLRPIDLFCAATIVAGLSAPVWAEPPSGCKFGQRVTDPSNNYGLIVSERDGLCLVRYGSAYGWIAPQQLNIAVGPPPEATAQPPAAVRPAAPPPAVSSTPAAPVAANSANPPRTASPATNSASGEVSVLRPAGSGAVVYRADPRTGHVLLTAEVNHTPVRFVVDTGATFVALTMKDAEAAGIRKSDLTFDRITQTANGTGRAALVNLREIRLDRSTAVENVAAFVHPEGLLHNSLLGMSFLQRLKGFEMHDGALTLNR